MFTWFAKMRATPRFGIHWFGSPDGSPTMFTNL
jgi:hypothetical protein